MEMKDIILSTLQEFEDDMTTVRNEPTNKVIEDNKVVEKKNTHQTGIEELRSIMNSVQKMSDSNSDNDDINEKDIYHEEVTNENVQNVAPRHEIPMDIEYIQNTTPKNIEPSISDTLKTRGEISLVNQIENEAKFLNSLRERVLVIFEGLQSPNNRNLDAKVDLIINFMEYQLAIIDERLDNIRRG